MKKVKRPYGVITVNGVKFVPYPTDIILDRTISHGARILYMVYRSDTSDKKFQTDLNNKKAAGYLGVSRGTIIRLKTELAKAGWISINERGYRGLPDIITVNDNKQFDSLP
ncbi:MAG: helix-turn-helix domain-containing protein, partial [Methanosarcinaceae archaeon]|nr:helix-turn-helix domain-containing protein [Methanosarcinaceae archaeon]